MKYLKNILSAVALTVALAFTMLAAPAEAGSKALFGALADNYITRTSVQLPGEATWVPALEVRIDGETVKVAPGDTVNGVLVTRNHILSERGAAEFVELTGIDVKLVGSMSGGGWHDRNGNGVVDDGEVSGSGW